MTRERTAYPGHEACGSRYRGSFDRICRSILPEHQNWRYCSSCRRCKHETNFQGVSHSPTATCQDCRDRSKGRSKGNGNTGGGGYKDEDDDEEDSKKKIKIIFPRVKKNRRKAAAVKGSRIIKGK